jgi:hypothetical protein
MEGACLGLGPPAGHILDWPHAITSMPRHDRALHTPPHIPFSRALNTLQYEIKGFLPAHTLTGSARDCRQQQSVRTGLKAESSFS